MTPTKWARDARGSSRRLGLPLEERIQRGVSQGAWRARADRRTTSMTRPGCSQCCAPTCVTSWLGRLGHINAPRMIAAVPEVPSLLSVATPGEGAGAVRAAGSRPVGVGDFGTKTIVPEVSTHAPLRACKGEGREEVSDAPCQTAEDS